MIIVMKPGSSREEIDHVVKKVEGVGLKAVLLQGTVRIGIAFSTPGNAGYSPGLLERITRGGKGNAYPLPL